MGNPQRFQGLPDIIYGTAFKFEKSARLTQAALENGFRAIDTAGSKSAYRESLVGEGIAAVFASGKIKRSELYIQTKFSPYKAGKDPVLYPYDTTKSIPEQVEESIASSLANLGVTYIDCLVLHSLYPDIRDTLVAWKAMEALVPSIVASLGVSNVDLESLRQLCEVAAVKPCTVQNRFTRDTVAHPNSDMPSDLPYPLVSYDIDVREYCHKQGIAYAPWGLLWGNPALLDDPEHALEEAGREVGISKEIACFACMRSLGGCVMTILCGTTVEARMHETLTGLAKVQIYLAESDQNRKTWNGHVDRVRAILQSD